MLKHLIPLIPEHVCYCEVFAGGLALLLAKKRSQAEVVNDWNNDLVALYLCVQKHKDELIRYFESSISSRFLLKLYLADRGLTDIERSCRFLLRNRISFAANGRHYGFSRGKSGGGRFRREYVIGLIEECHKRLDNVGVENLTWQRCLDYYDSKETFFFLDPPYLHAAPVAYDGWQEDQMTEFRDRVDALKGKWMITVDDSEFNRSLWKHCQLRAVTTRNGCVNNRHAPEARFGELIITPS